MTKQENDSAEVSESTEAEEAGSPALKELASLLRSDSWFIIACEDRPADYLLPCSSLIAVIENLCAQIRESVNESVRHITRSLPDDGT